jgi:hypothetical protein
MNANPDGTGIGADSNRFRAQDHGRRIMALRRHFSIRNRSDTLDTIAANTTDDAIHRWRTLPHDGSDAWHDEGGQMSVSALRRLHLGVRDLDESELRLLQVFLRFTGRTPHAEWTVATDGEEDLVLRDAAGLRATPPGEAGGAPVVWIAGAGPAPEPALRRPLQIESFAHVLRTREAELGCVEGSAAVAPPPSPSPPAPTPTPTPAPTPTPTPMPAPAPAPATQQVPATAPPVAPPRPQAAAPAVAPAAPRRLARDGGGAYRLVRWPGADLMRGRPKFVRMLGFLTQKPMDVERLVVLSGIDEASCLELLGLLDERGLLARVEAPAPSPAAPPAARAAAPAAPPPPDAPGGMLQRLRRRLGL